MIDIAVSTNASYLPWVGTMILSCLIRNPGQALSFHVLHTGGLEPDCKRLAAMVNSRGADIVFHEADPLVVSQLPSTGGPLTWLRLLLPDLLPDRGRILYLDGDTLVVDSIAALWATPLNGSLVAAVPNVVEPSMRDHVASLGIADPKLVFNAGVLLMNLELMRAERSIEQVIRFALSRDDSAQLPWWDQDALNAVFAGRWRALHPRWNAQNSFWMWHSWARDVFGDELLREAMSAPAILHFEGPGLCKPWHYLCQHPWRDEYHRTLALTPWTGTPPQGRTAGTWLIRQLPVSKQLPAFVRLQLWRRWSARHRVQLAARVRDRVHWAAGLRHRILRRSGRMRTGS